MTTHGDAVGQSAIPAVSPAPTPEDTPEPAPPRGSKTRKPRARGASSAARATPPAAELHGRRPAGATRSTAASSVGAAGAETAGRADNPPSTVTPVTTSDKIRPETEVKAAPDAEATPEPKTTPEAQAQAAPTAEAEEKPEADVVPAPEPETAPEATPEAEVEPEAAPEPEAEPTREAELKPEAETTPEVELKPGPEAELKPGSATDADVEPNPGPETELKPGSTTDADVEPNPGPETELKPGSTTDAEPDPGPEADLKPGSATSTEAELEPEPETQTTPEEEPGPEPEVERVSVASEPVSEAAKGLVAALTGLRAVVDGTAYPLVMPSAAEAGRVGTALVSQLDDYLLPRLARLDAPLLVVVGGSTGAGKSTLVNSLVRAPVSASGVLRPTTRSPVLVCHPADTPWFRQGDLLPGMTRTTEASTDSRTLQLVAAPALGQGLAFLDAPDIDSVVDANRALATQLLAAADLWLFVTTAARYADAVPWELLRSARSRGTVIALVLDRVPPEAAGEISAHLGEMLAGHDMAAAPLFVLPETTLDGQGLLTEQTIAPLHDWFAQLAADAGARAAVVRQTLDGALSALQPAVDQLAEAADEQVTAAHALDERVRAAYRTGRRTVEQGLQDGRLLRGEVLARWQEFIGTGEFLRSLESRVGQLRDRLVAAVTGRPAPGRNLQAALESQISTLLQGVAADAAEQAYAGWQAHPAGAALLEPELSRASADLAERTERAVRDWQRHVIDLVRAEAGDKRFVARTAAYAVNATGLAVMIAVFTSTAFIPTGAEVAVGAGTTVAAQKVLEAIFGDQAIRALSARARTDLLSRVDTLFEAEAARYATRIEVADADPTPAAALRKAAAAVERSREELALTAGPAADLPNSALPSSHGDS